ncbi:MAG: hypothetical protein ACP5NI_04860 [Acetobacteraceae bacterium]
MNAGFPLASAVSAVLVLVAVEAVALLAWRARTGRGPRPLLANLLAGFALLLALRLALGGAGTGAISACLGIGFAAHLADLGGRWRGGR